MTWQHTFIPALPRARTVFLEAPTPYLIGVLIESNQGRYIQTLNWRRDRNSPRPRTPQHTSPTLDLMLGQKTPRLWQKNSPTLGLGKISTTPVPPQFGPNLMYELYKFQLPTWAQYASLLKCYEMCKTD